MIRFKNILLYSALFVALIVLLINCKDNKENLQQQSKLDSLIISKIDSFSQQLPRDYPVGLFNVMHQRKLNKDYIKISTAEAYNEDSISSIKEHKDKIIIFYSKNYFPINHSKVKFHGLKTYSSSPISLYHPRFVVLELTEKGALLTVPATKADMLNLFQYGDRSVPEPILNKK